MLSSLVSTVKVDTELVKLESLGVAVLPSSGVGDDQLICEKKSEDSPPAKTTKFKFLFVRCVLLHLQNKGFLLPDKLNIQKFQPHSTATFAQFLCQSQTLTLPSVYLA